MQVNRRNFIINGIATAGVASIAGKASAASQDRIEKGSENRAYWVNTLVRIARPVLSNLANATLRRSMLVEKAPGYALHPDATYVEAVGRTLAGVAPWLALADDATEEGRLRRQMRDNALQGLANAFDPTNPDRLNVDAAHQPIVDCAYLAHAFLRAPVALWEALDTRTKQRIIESFISLRKRKAWYSNWLLFPAITEVFLKTVDAPWDPARVDYALNKFDDWYVGDGWYSDGPKFSYDYYNSFVIHPMLVDLLRSLAPTDKAMQTRYEIALKRMRRFGEFQERAISPEGTFTPVGRSITYRTAAFQALAQLALMEQLPVGISNGQVRSALTAVHRRMYESPGVFSPDGWLQLGFAGHQPEIADYYTSTGSLYMATLSFLPLGLPQSHAFWTDPAADWTSRKAWSGTPIKKDYKVDY